MRDRDTRWFLAGERILDFTRDSSSIVRAAPSGAKLSDDFERTLGDAHGARADLESATHMKNEGRDLRALARDALTADIEAVARTARSIAVDSPGFDEKFPMPNRVSDSRLGSIATAFARDAPPHATLFEQHGLAAAVISGLPARIKALDDALEHQRAGRRGEIAANAAIRSAIASLRTATAGLHAIVMSGPKRDPSIVAVWQSARRLGPAKVAPAEEPAAKTDPASSPSKIA
jgi:hypothetical protein